MGGERMWVTVTERHEGHYVGRRAHRRLILCQLSATLAGLAIGIRLLLADNTTAGIAMAATSIISTPAVALVARRPLTQAEQEGAGTEPDH